MAYKSIRSRITNASDDASIADLFAAGCKWEGLRAGYFQQKGDTTTAQDCIGRQNYFQRELNDLAHPVECKA